MICCVKKTHFIFKDTYTERKGWKKLFPGNDNQKKAWLVIFLLDKIDFKLEMVIIDKEDHYIIIKRPIYKQDITIINNFPPKIVLPTYINQILTELKG